METHELNAYVLTACLEAGWINAEQQQMVAHLISHEPTLSVLDHMLERQMIDDEQADHLRQSIRDISHGVQAYHAETDDVPPNIEGTAIEAYLQNAVDLGASDLHLGPYSPALYRIHGNLVNPDPNAPRLAPAHTESLARQFLTRAQIRRVEEFGSVEFTYSAHFGNRFRTSVVRQRCGWESMFRVIDKKIRTLREIGMPKIVYDLLRYHNGLILVTGPVGCGKTTSLAAMIDQINKERREHIITLEEPIEYVFESVGCQITQREIGQHTQSFASALRSSLRQDPDIIMVGEMHDLQTTSLAITASETGHLVLATLHTSNASRTMQRVLDVFPVEQQAQIRTMVAESLRGVISQQLIPRADGKGRVLALEIMTNIPAIAHLIREGKNFQLPGVMQTGKKAGMQLMDDSLMELVMSGAITSDEGYQRAENKKVFAQALAQKG